MSYTAVSQPVHTSVLKSSLSIRFIEERQRKEQVEVAIATKFAALPWRFGRGSVICALKALLDRLGVSSVELYQLHWLAHHPFNRLCFPPLLTPLANLATLRISFSGQGYGAMKVSTTRLTT